MMYRNVILEMGVDRRANPKFETKRKISGETTEAATAATTST